MSLTPYQTQRKEIFFYFPEAGNFKHFPSTITIGDKAVSKAEAHTLIAIGERLKAAEDATFKEILMSGDHESILKFMQTAASIDGINSGQSFVWNHHHVLSWFLKDKEFYEKAIAILRRRKLYDKAVWSYSLYHGDEEGVQEFVVKSDSFKDIRATFLDTAQFKFLPKYKEFFVKDYLPLVKTRVHKLGDDTIKALTNQTFKKTYDNFLMAMTQKKSLNPFDQLIFISYLLVQDRIVEALELFRTIDCAPFERKGDSLLKIQFNYMKAYFDFYEGETTGFKIAKSISEQYQEYPVITWRMKFLEILDQLKEVEGEGSDDEAGMTTAVKKDDKKDNKKMMKFDLDGTNIVVKYDNIPSITVKYYLIDPEVAFSKTPFLQNSGDANDSYSYVKEIKSTQIPLDPNLKSVTLPIDKQFISQNVMIEVNVVFHHEMQTYFASDFKVTIYENYGELKVTDVRDKPLSQVYVKVYARMNNGDINLYKDGYTDIRGKFEYESENLENVNQFSLLLLSEEKGSQRKECKPSKTVISTVGQERQDAYQDYGFLKKRQVDKHFSKAMPSKMSKKKKGKKG